MLKQVQHDGGTDARLGASMTNSLTDQLTPNFISLIASLFDTVQPTRLVA
jgi:hypothetical protein